MSWFSRIFSRQQTEFPHAPVLLEVGPTVPPGEIKVERNWTDNPVTDTTVITIGGQVHPEHLEAIKAILKGKAHVTRYPKPRQGKLREVGGVL